jgi:hypothetical protein
MRPRQLAWVLLGAALVAVVGVDFARATTFLGDDYLFRAFARLEANPFLAFVADKHGGEYYRPIPMLLWWLLERVAGGQAWPFALVAFLLHGLCASLLVVLGRALGMARRTAGLAGLLFFVAPAEREAALWFSASTDLLAVAASLGSVAAWLSGTRRGRWVSVTLAAVAYFSKETALVLPALLLAGHWYRARPPGEAPSLRRGLISIIPHAVVAALYLGARCLVLRGLGGTNDPAAPGWAFTVQLAGGLVHAVTAYAPLPEWVAWAAGVPGLGVAAVVAWRRTRVAGFALVLVLAPLVLLPAAGWVVGARYFYLPAAGIFLLVAVALEAAPPLGAGFVVAMLLGLGLGAGHQRAADVRLYREAVAAADRAVSEGLLRGHRVFFVRGGVKDLDLALKLLPARSRPEAGFVVIPDVPASFVWLPHDLADRLHFLLAEPPLPTAGAYRFGGERIAGQARREEAPDLDEVLTRLPELRIIQLLRRGSTFTWADRTEDYRRMAP